MAYKEITKLNARRRWCRVDIDESHGVEMVVQYLRGIARWTIRSKERTELRVRMDRSQAHLDD
jgi:hypothetical protein